MREDGDAIAKALEPLTRKVKKLEESLEALTRRLQEDEGLPSRNTRSSLKNGVTQSLMPALTQKTPLPTALPFDYFLFDRSVLYPSQSQARICWRTFMRDVDPLVKVLYRPGAEWALLQAVKHPGSLNKDQTALVFAICFACISAMSMEEVDRCFDMNKSTALATYRLATEQALMRAGLFSTGNLVVAQACVLFVSFIGFNTETEQAWVLTGLARRIVPSMTNKQSGLQREIIKRLRWQLWYLDFRAREVCGRGNTGIPNFSSDDLQCDIPLNIADIHLDPNDATTPFSRPGWTEMSFTLIRLEIAKLSRQFQSGHLSPPQTEQLINECEHNIQLRYLQHCDGSEEIHWLAQHVSRVLIAEMRFNLYGLQQGTLPVTQTAVQQAVRDQLFSTAIDIIDLPNRLEREPLAASKWFWLRKAYWCCLPLEFLLTELCYRVNGEFVDLAWKVAEEAFSQWTPEMKNLKQGATLAGLMKKARTRKLQNMQRTEAINTYSLPEYETALSTEFVAEVGENSFLAEQHSYLEAIQLFPDHGPVYPITESIPFAGDTTATLSTSYFPSAFQTDPHCF
jgi:hypothetical protein